MNLLEEFITQARFLIVDDEPLNVCLLEENLEMEGQHNFRSTTDPRQALAIFQEYQPDIVLLDLMMPHIDGFGVLAQLREVIPPDENLPVVILTADIARETRQRALSAGARDFLTKPFDSVELQLRLRNLLEMRFLHQGLRRQNRNLDALVTERTQELREAQRQAIQRERLHAFSEMAGGVVHDFSNLLMVLTGYSEQLQRLDLARDAQKARKYLEIIGTATTDATHVVNRLRHFYRPRHEDDCFLPTNLKELTKQAADLAQPRWKQQAQANGRDITLKLDLQAVPPALCNPSEIREVIINLIFNAVDAMPQGGTLTLRVGACHGKVFFEVADTGMGMSEEVRRRCLEPFFSTKGERGTGLGLAMVHGIIRRHDGTLEVESEEGKGTLFRVRLPQTRNGSSADLDSRVSAPQRKLRILMAEDDAAPREVIATQLRSSGHNVEAVHDGAEALERLHAADFDLLLTNLSMPRLNGVGLAAAARKLKQSMPIIMLTGFGEMLLLEGNKPPGVDLLLSKPVTHDTLAAAIVRVTA